jgi:hypothetical protein
MNKHRGLMSALTREKSVLICIIAISIAARILLLLRYEGVWWDEAVYIGMGKYLVSAGTMGIWEIFRPLGLPVMSSIILLSGLDVLSAGRAVVAAMSVCVIVLTYFITKKISTELKLKNAAWAGVIAVSFAAAAPVFFMHSGLWLSAIPSTLFAMISVYFFASSLDRKSLALAGFFAGLAVLTRFQQGIMIFALAGSLLLHFLFYRNTKKHRKIAAYGTFIKNIIILCGVWFLAISPYLVFNQASYGTALGPLFEAQKKVSVTYEFYGSGQFFYFPELLSQNVLFAFAIVGIVFVAWRFLRKHNEESYGGLAVMIAMIGFLAYFSWMPHKEARFLIEFLPYVAILSAIGIAAAYDTGVSKFKIAKNGKRVLLILLSAAIIAAFAFSLANQFSYALSGPGGEPEIFDDYYGYFIHNKINASETIYASSPVVSAYIDNRVYVVFDSPDPAIATDSVEKEKIRYAMVNTCDILCQPSNYACMEKRESFIEDIKNIGSRIFYRNESGCEYIIIRT